jgi:hypothetical protein
VPLIRSSSDRAFRSNVAEMRRSGHPRDQALAAAYRVKRKGYAEGGAPDDPELLPIEPRPLLADVSGFPRAAGRLIAPNVTSVLSGEDRPPVTDITGMRPGKVPSAEDPRLAGAVPEIAGFVGAAIPGGGIGGVGARMAESALTDAALPAIGRVAPRVASAVDTQTIAGLMGAAANLAPTSAEAAPKPTREQQRALEVKKQELALQADAEQKRMDREKQARLEQSNQDIARQKAQAQVDIDKQTAQAEYERQEKLRQTNLPFRQKYPELAQTLPFLGTAAAFAVPFMTRLTRMPATNAFARQWASTADEAEQALAAGDHVVAARAVNQLEAYGRQHAESLGHGTSPALYATSAALPTEASLLPSEYDAAMLPPNDPNRQAAMGVLTDPLKLGERALPGLLQGVPAASVGAKIGIPGQRVAPVARSEGIIATMPDRSAPLPARTPPPAPASLSLTPAEQKHLNANQKALTSAVPSANLAGDTLKFDQAHTQNFIDFVNKARTNRATGERLPPSYYKTNQLGLRINNSPDGFRDGGAALQTAYRVKREGFASGGSPTPWQVRSEAHSMVHSGPIQSIVPGRTDHHPMSVASGSYVINADTVSHIGQNNSNAGQAILSHMFGGSGPYGMGRDMATRSGHGMPAASKMRMRSDVGGARGEGRSGPVEINAAGGEFVVPPEVVARIGQGDVARGHEILDKWMEKTRKEHIRTLQRLPGPAKS